MFADWCLSFTNLVGMLLEARLWDIQRFKGTQVAAGVEKNHGVGAVPTSGAPAVHQTV